MENQAISSENNDKTTSPPALSPEEKRKLRIYQFWAIVGTLVIITIFVGLIIFLLQPSTPTNSIRDILIIGMAFELLILGIATILLIIQLARLINLIQNEIQPVLESANTTINTIRGTAEFLSNNMVQPISKLSGYVASIRQALELINFGKK